MSQLEEGVGKNPLTQSSGPRSFCWITGLIKKHHCGELLGSTAYGSLEAELKAERQKADKLYSVWPSLSQQQPNNSGLVSSTFGSFSINTYEYGTQRQLMTEVTRTWIFSCFYLCFFSASNRWIDRDLSIMWMIAVWFRRKGLRYNKAETVKQKSKWLR